VILADAKWIVEKLWREFFSDPSQWWDNRTEKVNGITFITSLLVDAENSSYSYIVSPGSLPCSEM